MKKENGKFKAEYNEKRDCFISKDEKYICYRSVNIETGRKQILRYEIGKDGVTEDLAVWLDAMNYEEDLSNRYANEHRAISIEQFMESEIKSPSLSFQLSTDSLDGKSEWQFREEALNGSELMPKIRDVIETKCSERQQKIYFEHFGMQKQLEEIRKEESAEEGVEKSLQAIVNVKKDIIKKVAKELGVTPIKLHKYPNKQQ